MKSIAAATTAICTRIVGGSLPDSPTSQAPLPVIAQRAFNDEQRRVSHESFRQLYKKAPGGCRM